MDTRLFNDFLKGKDTLRVYQGRRLVFSSAKERLLPLLDYLDSAGSGCEQVTIFDRVVGNAAALLAVKAGCREICSPLGSELAASTLDGRGIRYHFSRTVPHIINQAGTGMCPMEELSLGKGPEEFYAAIRSRR